MIKMSIDPLTIVIRIIPVIALLAFLFVNYDRIILRYLSWRHDPSVDLGINLGEEYFIEEDSIPCADLQPYGNGLVFGVAVANSGEMDVQMDLEIAVDPLMQTTSEYFDSPDEFNSGYSVENVYHGFGEKPSKRYKFNSFSLPAKCYGRHINFILGLNPEEVKVFKSSRVLLSGQVHADASQFSGSLLKRRLLENIGEVKLGTIERRYDILGPHHEEVDMADLESDRENVRRVSIDGPVVKRDDGSKVCIGYYEDEQGRVVNRFALPPGDHEVDETVDNVRYVDSMEELSEHPVDDKYKHNPPEPPWGK